MYPQNLDQWKDAYKARYESAERRYQQLKDHYEFMSRLYGADADYLAHVREDMERLKPERPCSYIIERFGYLAHAGIKKEIPQISPDTTIREIDVPKGTRTIRTPTGVEVELKQYAGGIVFPPAEPITERFVAGYDAETDTLWLPTFVVTPEQERQELVKALVTLAKLNIQREWKERGWKPDDKETTE